MIGVLFEDIIGLDSNVLIDLVESEDFKREIRERININVLKIYTTNIALGEARHVLIKYRNNSYETATQKLIGILNEFNIIKIKHNKESDELANRWFDIIRTKIFLHKFSTFLNDFKIIANLFNQVNINVFITEDKDIEKAITILKIPLNVLLVGEASFIDDFKVKEFFKGNHRYLHKKK